MAISTIVVTRAKLYPSVARPGPAWRWTYSYATDNAAPVDYGTHLASLRGMLKRRYPGATVVCEWQQQMEVPVPR
jgi:hypothetical protein